MAHAVQDQPYRFLTRDRRNQFPVTDCAHCVCTLEPLDSRSCVAFILLADQNFSTDLNTLSVSTTLNRSPRTV